jgi:DNA helicase HerA-like ATPase
VALMKQGRAFGIGVVVATQNPMDLDYRALSNAGLWCIGRLQADADRERVIEGLGDSAGHEGGLSKSELAHVVKKLAPRWFVVRNAHAREEMTLVQPRWATSLMLGPMTRTEIRRARGRGAERQDGDEPAVGPNDEETPHTQNQQKGS